IKKTSELIDNLLKKFEDIKLNKKYIKNVYNLNLIKKKQQLYFFHIILTDLIEKYEYNLENVKTYLYQMYKENIKKIKINSDMVNEFKKEINYINNMFDYYNSKICFLQYFNFIDKEKQLLKNDSDLYIKKYSYIYSYHKLNLLKILNEIANEIINLYISKGLYIRNYNFFNSPFFFKKYSFLNYIIDYIAKLSKNRINLNFNYLSTNAFGLSSYK
ncbi:conserved protein, unknown function, partial [Hepatocystis sp. ex Piliocolobus tephrosceles]